MDLIKPGSKIDFVSKMKPAVFLSWAIILIGIISLVYHKGPNWGVEFIGGTGVHVKFSQPIQSDDLRSLLSDSGYNPESVQQLGLSQDNEYLIGFSAEEVTFDKIEDFRANLDKVFEGKGANILRIDYIGPKVGAELINKAIISVLLGCIGILVYLMLRFEFQFALGAVFAVVHDVLIAITALSLTDKEFTLTIVAALLTIIGFSVNDTIVIFDRIRENLKEDTKIGYKQLVNEAINQTLSRTVLTVITVFLVLVALFFLGGSVIHDFAFTMIVGVVTGTYSSIFIATAFAVYWRYRKGQLT